MLATTPCNPAPETGCQVAYSTTLNASPRHVCAALLQDRIASLNGASVEHVLRQDRAAFVRLIGRSVVQVPAAL
jgi:hypothetical protein